MHAAVSKQLFDEELASWPPDLPEARGWIIHRASYPILDCAFTAPNRTPLRLRLDFTDWDDRAPSITLHDADGQLLKNLPPNPTGVFNGGPHPITGHPFVCMAGSHEFHTHSSHLNQPWDQFRSKPSYTAGNILGQLWQAWLKGSG